MTSSGPRPPAAETSLGALGAQEAAPVVIAMWPWVAPPDWATFTG